MALSTTIILKFSGAAVERGLALIKKGFSSVNKAGGKMFSSLIKGALKWGAILGAPLSAASIYKIAEGASDTASEFEQMRLKFTMFTGSMEGAVKLMDQLRKVDIVSNLDLQTLGEGAAKLMAFGMSADDVADTVEKLSKVSGGSADAFQGLTLAFGQTMSNMSLKGDDLRQYVERGWNPLQNIMARTGETMAVIRKRMEDHKISMEEVKQALADATTGTGRFARAHELGSKTFLAATSRMQSQWAMLKDAFGTPLNTHLGQIFDQITAKLPQLTSQAKAFGDEIGRILSATFNSIGNGSFIELIKSGFSVASTNAGEKLIAAFMYGGKLVGDMIKGFLKDFAIAYEHTKGGKDMIKARIANGVTPKLSDIPMLQPANYSMQQALTDSNNVLGSSGAIDAFYANISKNKDPLVPMNQPAQPGATSELMKQAVAAMQEMVKQQQMTNRSLAPTP